MKEIKFCWFEGLSLFATALIYPSALKQVKEVDQSPQKGRNLRFLSNLTLDFQQEKYVK